MEYPINWRKHESEKQKNLRRELYAALKDAGYCVKGCRRGRDFKTAKVKKIM